MNDIQRCIYIEVRHKWYEWIPVSGIFPIMLLFIVKWQTINSLEALEAIQKQLMLFHV